MGRVVSLLKQGVLEYSRVKKRRLQCWPVPVGMKAVTQKMELCHLQFSVALIYENSIGNAS